MTFTSLININAHTNPVFLLRSFASEPFFFTWLSPSLLISSSACQTFKRNIPEMSLLAAFPPESIDIKARLFKHSPPQRPIIVPLGKHPPRWPIAANVSLQKVWLSPTLCASSPRKVHKSATCCAAWQKKTKHPAVQLNWDSRCNLEAPYVYSCVSRVGGGIISHGHPVYVYVYV